MKRTTYHHPRRLGGMAGLAVAVPLTLAMGASAMAAPQGPPGAAAAVGHGAPDLQVRVKGTVVVDGEQFKDLNANGALDPYEDWRLEVEERVADLVGRMTLPEKAGLMLIDTLNAACDPATQERGVLPPTAAEYVNTQHMHRFIFRNVITSADRATCGGTGGGFAASTSVTPAETARFMNRMQELSEGTRLGIPVLYKSNARNHIDPDVRAGINEAAGAMSAFPKEAGIAAAALGEESVRTGRAPTTGDMSVVEDFAEVMGEEWRSVGLRGMYGYMADLSTEPRWYRTHETFTEDADLGADIMGTLVETLQGPVHEAGVSLSPESPVALTMKHFPGGGPQELGLDPHYAFGKTQVYPGGGFGYHLRPFEAAIDAGVAAIMPYYGVPMGVTHEGVTYDQTGMAFSDQIVNDLLRGELGFDGYVNSDTGIINDRAWGLEESTVPERVAAAINGGTDTLSGFHDVQTIIDLVDADLVSEERVDLAAERLLTPMFQLGLFENPYSDEGHATATVGNAANREVGLDLQRKSLVLLQNEDGPDGDPTLPLEPGSDVYVLGDVTPGAVAGYGYAVTDGNTTDPAVRPSAEGSDYAVISVSARNVNTSTYVSNDPATGLNPAHINPIVLPGTEGLDGESPYGAADACVAYAATVCTDNGLRFGGSLPWESSTLDFTGMSTSQSWQISPSLDQIQAVMDEVGDPRRVVLQVYFRQPFVMDEASGLLDAGAIVAGFGTTDRALLDVLSGRVAPQGKMPFALAKSRLAVEEQYSDLPGYEETTDGELFGFGHGLTYERTPGEPQRILDVAEVAPGRVTCFPVAGRYGVPSDAAGVAVNVTAVANGPGYAVVFPDSRGDGRTPMPATSTVNFEPGEAVANSTLVRLPDNGELCYATKGASQVRLIVDLHHHLDGDSDFVLRDAVRILDTRPLGVGEIDGPVGSRALRTVQVAGVAGVPADAESVLLNVTTAGVTGEGHLRVFPGGQTLPTTSVVNYASGVDKANAAVVKLSDDGTISFWSDSTRPVHVILDVLGHTLPGSEYTPITPTRVVDTRAGTRVGDLTGPLAARTVYSVPVETAGMPTGATAAVVNVIAINPTTSGHLRVYPDLAGAEGAPPYTSTINYIPGRAIPNQVLVPIDEDGRINVWSDQHGGTVELAVDVVGYVVP